MTDIHTDNIFWEHEYRVAVKDQTTIHYTLIQSCDAIALFNAQTGTPQGGSQNTDICNSGLQVAMHQMLQNTIEVSPMFFGSHSFLFEPEDPICLLGTPTAIQWAAATFFDDIINRVADNDIKELKIKTEEMDEVIEKQLEMSNVFLNRTT